jgi:hypothetical protein
MNRVFWYPVGCCRHARRREQYHLVGTFVSLPPPPPPHRGFS